MIHASSGVAIAVFLACVGAVLAISFYLGGKAKSAQGYFAAGGGIHWAVNGIAFAGDYLSAASFLGICGMIAFFGYDGFLYSIGYLAGWIVALFIIAEPMKRLGRYTFADALDNKFNSRGIKLAAAISTLVVSCFYLIPQMVGAGALVTPLLGFPHWVGVLIVGCVVTLIVTTAGMVSTTWVQFIKGSALVALCTMMTVMILARGVRMPEGEAATALRRGVPAAEITGAPGAVVLPEEGGWTGKPFVRVRTEATGLVSVWRRSGDGTLDVAQTLTVMPDGRRIANGRPQGTGPGQGDLIPAGQAARLPGGAKETGPLSPIGFLQTMQDSEIVLWGNEKIAEADGGATTVYFQKPTTGKDFMAPGSSPTFRKVRSEKLGDKLDFLSLMLALFCGTASLPHILIRYYTVRTNQRPQSTVVESRRSASSTSSRSTSGSVR
jgi:cation/acetate symporter